MDADQWQVIRKIFHEAIDLPPGERGDFVSRAAAGDESLRIEVESLLASHDDAASFIEPPGDQVTTIVPDEVPPIRLAVGSAHTRSCARSGGVEWAPSTSERKLTTNSVSALQ